MERIMLLFDTHHVRICHCEEQRDIQWARGNITFHLPDGEEDASPLSQRVFYKAGYLRLQILAKIRLENKTEEQTKVDEQYGDFQGMSRQITSEVNMRFCLSIGNFGTFPQETFMLSSILLHYPTGWPQKATIRQRTVPLVTVVLRPPPTVRAFPPLPSHLFSPILLPNAN